MRSTHTKSAVLAHARGAVGIESIYLGEPGPGEVLLRMEACGVCHSDLFVAGLEKLPLAPLTLGHEGIGRVESTGPGVAGWLPGDRAGVTFLGTSCGSCEWCLTGRERFCPKQTNFGYTLHGALSEYAIVPASALIRVPEELPAAVAAPLCCAGWTAFGALREAALERGQSVALFGLGGLGHLALQLAKMQGLRIAAVDIAADKLDMAREWGAEAAVHGDSAGRTLQKEYGGVDAALVLTPSSSAIQQAFRSLKRNGTLVLVGLATNQYELPLVDTVLKGIAIRGSYLGSRQDLAEVFRLAGAGFLKPHIETHSLAETPDVLERLRRGELMGRAVITW
ncbi:MAG TPA: alcohol dehydrogenase catalytic domain-containing protein [Candidatus Sulfopaludibacter sp.]|jgi:propanol-preferring alcohol dehydrogenase|nr:alcohol dehydrogenase catalytic domain-containing protein [Candidatus Sulfopaludibacter sp.]